MAKSGAKKRTGRPRKEIDLQLLDRLSVVGCSIEEIGAMLRRSGLQIDDATLKRRMSEPTYRRVRDDARASGRVRLRSAMYRIALAAGPKDGPGCNVLIHLSKHELGMTDKAALELSGRVDSAVEVTSARERIAKKLDTLAERIQSRVAGLAAAAGAATRAGEPVGS